MRFIEQVFITYEMTMSVDSIYNSRFKMQFYCIQSGHISMKNCIVVILDVVIILQVSMKVCGHVQCWATIVPPARHHLNGVLLVGP